MNLSMQAMKKANTRTQPQSETPFNIEDLNIFNDDTLQVILRNWGFGLTVEKLARSLHGVNDGLIQRIERNLFFSQCSKFLQALHSSIPESLSCCVSPLQGRFDKLPLEDDSVDTALSCSAFTSDPVQGGEPGLAELRRVIKPGGKLIIIWPRSQDHRWFNKHSFCYVELPLHEEMLIRFRTLESAMRCVQHFYANNAGIVDFIMRERKPEIPFSMLGLNPPCGFYWLRV